MKRITSVVLLIGIILSLCACVDENTGVTDTRSPFDYNNDFQYCYNDIGNNKLPCAESDKGYYYRGDHGIILFIDKNSMEGIPLCSKSHCMHNDPDDCDAYGYGDIQYNSGYLYTDISEYNSEKMSDVSFIFRVSEDGSEKEKITNGFNEMLLEWLIHRGYIYCLTNSGLYRLPLSAAKSEPQQIISFKELSSESINIDKFTAYENYIYVSVSSLFDEDTSEDNNSAHLFAYNIETENYSEIKFDGKVPNIATFADSNMITFEPVKNDDNSYNTVYYISDLNGDNRKKFAEYPSGNYLYSDGKYIYIDNGAYLNFSGKAEESTKNIFGQTIKVYDLQMNEVDSFVLPFDRWIDMCAQGAEHFLISSVTADGESELYCIDKKKITEYKGAVADKKDICPLNWKKR